MEFGPHEVLRLVEVYLTFVELRRVIDALLLDAIARCSISFSSHELSQITTKCNLKPLLPSFVNSWINPTGFPNTFYSTSYTKHFSPGINMVLGTPRRPSCAWFTVTMSRRAMTSMSPWSMKRLGTSCMQSQDFSSSNFYRYSNTFLVSLLLPN